MGFNILLFTVCVLFIFTASGEKPVPLCNYTQENDSSAEVFLYSKDLSKLVKERPLVVRVKFAPRTSNSSQTNKTVKADDLFCPLFSTDDELEKNCSSRNANFEFGGVHNDTFNLRIKTLSLANEGIYCLNVHLLKKNTECRLVLSQSGKELSEPYTSTTQKTVGSGFPANKSSSNHNKDTAEGKEDTTNHGLLVGCIFVTVLAVIVIGILVVYKFRRRLRCFISSLAQLNGSEDTELGQNSRLTVTPEAKGHRHHFLTTRCGDHDTVTPVQNGVAKQDVEVSSQQEASDTDEGENDPTDQQNLTGQVRDVERPHARVPQVPSTSSQETAPLLSGPTTPGKSHDVSDAEKGKDQLQTKCTDTGADLQQDVAPSTDGDCVEEAIPKDEGFEQFTADDLNEAREKATTGTDSNDTSNSLIATVQCILFGSSVTNVSDHDTGVT